MFAAREPDLVEDCLQEALLEIAKSLPRFRGESALRTWMFVISRRVCARFTDKRNKSRIRFPLGKQDDTASNAIDDAYPKRADMQIEMAEGNQKLWGLVRELPEKQRLSVLLYYAEEMSVSEVAKALKCSESAVKTHLSRAKDKLRDRLPAEDQNQEMRARYEGPTGR